MSRVELLGVFGDDLMVVNAARVSFHKESKSMTPQDEKLIKYLARNNHITPFFHPQVQFRICMPIFVAREWYRHQIGFARNEVSRRYVDEKPECFVPDFLRQRDTNVKQGSSNEVVAENDECMDLIKKLQDNSIELYQALLDRKVCPEQARIVLPQSMYTEFIETGSLAAYARLCKLRLDPHAQKEIQVYADMVSNILSEKFPVSWKCLMGDDIA
ncbi:MAG: FAD-dependent thymidylate synthase [Actinobacteria bacterium]|nr:FAD-dependent thymidylate synthase [Actinomycetota bacterium]